MNVLVKEAVCRRVVILVVVLLVAGSIAWKPVFAASFTVNIGDNKYNPPVSQINVGDSVRWVWQGLNQHTTTHFPSPPLWDSGQHTTGFQFTNTFRCAGSFPYRCMVVGHSTPTSGQTGTVVVVSTNLSPTAALTFPPANSVYAAPANINLTATASDADGTITNVQFRRNALILTNDTTSPYQFTDSNVAAGPYSYAAVAYDNAGDSFTNRVTVTVVAPLAVTLSNPTNSGPGQFQFRYTGNTGLRYVVEKTTDFLQWQTLITNSGPTTYTDTVATAEQSFYRVGRLPNP